MGVKGYGEGDATGMGLQNMKERARKIGGAIDITSNEDTGTVITLEGKIPHTVG